MKIRNRIVFPACGTNYATLEGFVSPGFINFHEARAEHVGLDIVGGALVRPGGGIIGNHVLAHDDRYVPGLAKLATAIKAKGATAMLQLVDGGARAGAFGCKCDPIGPSRIDTFSPIPARELSQSEIREVVTDFAEAAQRAYGAGFDGVEFHCAHLYLISEFLSPVTNRRNDKYGGSVENRARFILEILCATRERVPNDFLLCCRVNAHEPLEGGIQMGDLKTIARLLEEAGTDILSISGLWQKVTREYEGKAIDLFTSTCPRDCPEGNQIKYGIELRKVVKLPTISVGKIFSPQLAEDTLELKHADLIAMCRSLIADPELPRKVCDGRELEIHRCREDLRCLRSVQENKPLSCTMNKSLPPENINVPA